MTKAELLVSLGQLYEIGKRDPEQAHVRADNALLSFINDDEIAQAYVSIKKY